MAAKGIKRFQSGRELVMLSFGALGRNKTQKYFEQGKMLWELKTQTGSDE